MPGDEISVRHPHAVSPRDVGRGLVHVSVGGPDVGVGGEDDGVEPLGGEPVVEVDLAGVLEPSHPLLHTRDVAGLPHPGAGGVDVVGDVVRDVEGEDAVPVGEGAGRVREDATPLDVGESVQLRVAVVAQEGVEAPHGQIADLVGEELTRDEPAIDEVLVPGMELLVVVHRGEVDLDHLRSGGLEISAQRAPERHHRRAGLDREGAVGVGAHVDAGDREPHPREIGGGESGERLRSHLGGARKLDPRLTPPQVALGIGVVVDDRVEHVGEVVHRAGVGDDHVHRRHEGPVAAH